VRESYENGGLLTAAEAWTMPLASKRQNLFSKVDSLATSWTAVGIVVVDVRRSAAGRQCWLATTLLATQHVTHHQISRRVFQHFTT